jgi:RES domain-containing protein
LTADHRRVRPKALLDVIEAETPKPFAGEVWRVVTDGRDPLQPGRAGGRWDDGTFDALYTSSSPDGALAEAWFHASQGQPIIPSKPQKRLFRIEADLERTLDLTGDTLAGISVNMSTYGRLSYLQRQEEYPTTRQIAEVAFFYEYEAIIVPSARWPTSNVVVFTEHARLSQITVADDRPIDLIVWAQNLKPGD